MLRGKRAVITGGGRGFGRALCVWLAREGVEVNFCARREDDIQKTCSIITAESGMAKGYICDLTQPESISQFSLQLLSSDKPIDILILNAAQWLSGRLDDQPDTEIINTVSSGLTGSILLTQALLPGLRRSDSADIVSIISSCGVANFTDSIAHPAFFASKHGLSGFTTKLSQQLSEENIRVTSLYPPDFELTGLETFVDSQAKMGERLLNGRSIWETICFVLAQPRSCHISNIYFQGPTREDLSAKSRNDTISPKK
ncbi:SDR family oxidoreductase [Mangrovibacter phragmitis]|uniref:SDR family oxidoreductase n=1 Tax=Mangrovibacter phragmitis TaxID=1691903 RepID=UPI003369E914